LVKKFLVLGIGNAQVDILDYLSTRTDVEIHALSYSNAGRGLSYVNFFEVIDITDKASVLIYALEHRINFIYSVGSDVAMPTAMWVAEQLGIPHFVSAQTASLCNTKHELRAFLQGIYGSVPFETLDEKCLVTQVAFPAMVKPVDSQGQRGVSTVTHESDLLAAYEYAVGFSRSKTVIIENKIDGPEISVNTFQVNGKLVFFLPSDRLSWDGFDGGVIHKHILPTQLNAAAVKNVRKLVVDTLAKLDINEGPAYFQIKMQGDEPFLIEVTPRLDGCHMWRLIAQCTGVNLLDATISHLFSESVEVPSAFDITPGVLEFICQPPSTNFIPVQIDGDYDHAEYYYQAGDVVRSMNGKMEKCGYLIKTKPI
jgi:formate-dependent phosphoribosylglycinamide formyltransferase (GAR transformylase)